MEPVGNVKETESVSLVPVKVIHQEGNAVLVEWHDGTECYRVIIPKVEAAHGKVSSVVLSMMVYLVDFVYFRQTRSGAFRQDTR